VPAAQRPSGPALVFDDHRSLKADAGDEMTDEELAPRRAARVAPQPRLGRGYQQHILQADQGCDMDYLLTQFGESAGAG
jgi:hypothetical protein